MTTIETGSRAEQAAADYLTDAGYEIIERNYRRPHCEIDIVARTEDIVYFVEVKYRATDHFGSGLEYITDQKLKHMQRAAATWIRHYGWTGEYSLAAVEVGGPEFEILDFIESITDF